LGRRHLEVLADVVPIEPSQRKLDSRAAQAGDDVADARPVDLRITQRADDQRPRAMQLPDRKLEQRQGIGIHRMQILEDQHQRLV
jgi:hypothetical protein